jgi:hypothetical protein
VIKTIFHTKFVYWILFIYWCILLWWIKLQLYPNVDQAYLFNWSYGLIALGGAIYGIRISITKWGGWNSVIGRGLIFLSLGLLGQWFGLQIWTYYNVVAKVEVPYPSLADVGYFALIPAYTVAAIMFAKASGTQFSLKTVKGKIQAVIIPLIFLGIAYGLFLKDVGFDTSNLVKLFLDLGYPLGEIIPVVIALVTLVLSRKLLGGTMSHRIFYLIAAFSFQFITEYAFIYTSGKNIYVNGGINDLMYATSYTIMAVGLISFSDYK